MYHQYNMMMSYHHDKPALIGSSLQYCKNYILLLYYYYYIKAQLRLTSFKLNGLALQGQSSSEITQKPVTLKLAVRVNVHKYAELKGMASHTVFQTGTWVGTQATPQRTNSIALRNLVEVRQSLQYQHDDTPANYSPKFYASLQLHGRTTHGTVGVQTTTQLRGIIF